MDEGLEAMSTPDILGSVLAAFPDELRLRPRGTGFELEITARTLNGKLFGSRREDFADIAMAYEGMRNRQRNGPQRCACGLLFGQHAWDQRAASKRGACPERPGRYEPEGVQ
jgi:hypothetical protein